MIAQLANRLLLSIPVLFGVLALGFGLLQLVPGDPAIVLAGPAATEEVVESIRREMGLDRPLVTQFFLYLGRLLEGDMGRSLISNKTVVSELGEAIGPTAELMFACLVWSIPLGIVMGALAAAMRGSIVDRMIMAFSVAGVSLPVFFIGLVLIQYLGVAWRMFPFLGRGGPLWTAEGLDHIVLPALTLGLIFVGPVARMTRSSVLEVLRLDHVRTARAKGLSETQVLMRHGLRNALIPVVTLVGLQAGYLLGGAVVTESIFSWPGVGRLAVGAILSSDFPLAQGAILTLALAFIIINMIGGCCLCRARPAGARHMTLADTAASEPRRSGLVRRLARDPGAALSLAIMVLVVFGAVFAPWISPHDPYAPSRAVMQGPAWAERGSIEHILGTDGQGRDILSRVLYGSRLTLLIGLISVFLGGVVGSAIGLLSAFYSRIDPYIMRFIDMLLSFPAILLGLALVAVLGPGAVPVIIALAIATVPDCARISRSIGVGVMAQDYMEAGRAVGLSDFALFRRYLLRNCLSSILIFMSLRFGQVILIGSALSFLGLGARPPVAELGMMAAQGRDFLLFAPHIAVIPSVCIFIIVLAANVAGDALRDALDPRLRA
jgi:glutathione transport system permease protein